MYSLFSVVAREMYCLTLCKSGSSQSSHSSWSGPLLSLVRQIPSMSACLLEVHCLLCVTFMVLWRHFKLIGVVFMSLSCVYKLLFHFNVISSFWFVLLEWETTGIAWRQWKDELVRCGTYPIAIRTSGEN